MIRAKIAVGTIVTIGAVAVALSTMTGLFSAETPPKSMECSQLGSTYLDCIGPEHWIVPSPEQMTKAQ
jgi:hypothetical protein